MPSESADQGVKVYWMPGCSACLRMKEFVGGLDIQYALINVLESPQCSGLLETLGLEVPAVVVGDQGVSGVDLAGIAKLVRRPYSEPVILEPKVLQSIYDHLVNTAVSLIRVMPPEALDFRTPGRDRNLRALILHAATVMGGFTVIEDTNYFTAGYEFIPLDSRSAGRTYLASVFQSTAEDFNDWWEKVGLTDSFDRIVESKHGRVWTLLEAFERAVWHTAHHVRQLDYFLGSEFGVQPKNELNEELLLGLPLPEGIYA
jgi:glutaredoxin